MTAIKFILVVLAVLFLILASTKIYMLIAELIGRELGVADFFVSLARKIRGLFVNKK
jgi:hypothetical protein